MTKNNKQWLTPTELQEEYGFSKSTQSKYRMERKIPFSKIGKYIRYNRDQINQWLESNKVEVV
ncbi:MAG TPA: DNA-binding protein [Sulfurovum sp.]|nr:DNA-binding protein [Sulfurovum sp.]